jgi:hypothetical protein
VYKFSPPKKKKKKKTQKPQKRGHGAKEQGPE